MERSEQWEKEELFFEGDTFFQQLERDIRSATISVDLESYIFDSSPIAHSILEALIQASKKGVRVRVMVDGIGSWGWVRTYATQLRDAHVPFRVYHQLPWERWLVRGFPGISRLIQGFRFINTRNHRKLCIIDGKSAFLGSINISQVHSKRLVGDKAWHDVAAKVSGPAVSELAFAFERAWMKRRVRMQHPLTPSQRSGKSISPLLRLNTTRRMRQRNFRSLCDQIRSAQKRVWITNAYFVPDDKLIEALLHAAQKKIDVRIIGPNRSDVAFVPYVSTAFYLGLLHGGAKVYRYLPSILHSKTLLIDDWALVGSSNLNYRSLRHDLEADVVLTHEQSRTELSDRFLEDLKSSQEVTNETLRLQPWYERCIGWIALSFRYWM